MPLSFTPSRASLCAAALLLFTPPAQAGETPGKPLEPYSFRIPGTEVVIDMVPIPGGTFTMGSPSTEKGRKKDEGPQREITVRPFWMSKTEITWEAYAVYLDVGMKRLLDSSGGDDSIDAVTYPTPPYADETFGYGGNKQPAIALTWHAVMEFARWLSAKTGQSYRLPTEVEWEYACRAGTTTPYSFGKNAKELDAYAFFAKNSKKRPQPVGQKSANPFGLHDMHGNVAEWVLDHYAPDFYARTLPADGIPVNLPTERRFPHVVRGGGWRDKPEALRCAARRFSEPWWSKQDPQNPRSIWWHTEATDVGFRLVRLPDEYPAFKQLRSQITENSP